MGFSLIAFKKDRRRKRLVGVVLFWGGLALLVLDMTTTFPTPLQGQYAVWWLLVVALGAGLWMASKRLTLEEADQGALRTRAPSSPVELAANEDACDPGARGPRRKPAPARGRCVPEDYGMSTTPPSADRIRMWFISSRITWSISSRPWGLVTRSRMPR